MAVMMPASDQAVLGRRDEIVAALRAIVPGEGVIDSRAEMIPYESDGLMAYRQPPMVVVLPDTTEQVSQVLKYCFDQGIKVVPRGAGTSLSGGALPLEDGVLLGLGKFKRIREIDFDNRVVVTEPGVTNLAISQAVAHAGFYYAPDPSSQIACSIGGNVAENSGGVHCLKYGMTTNNVLGCELVLMTGEILRLGGKHLDAGGYDLLGIVTGSEGLLGVVTEVTVRILKKPQTARAALIGFAASEDGGECVARIIGAGIIPGGMEMMDRPAIAATEEFVHAGYPLDVEALLIVELDGPRAEVDHLLDRVQEIARAQGGRTVILSGKVEAELAGLSEEEAVEFRHELGIERSGLDDLAAQAYDLLGLMTFLTAGEKEARAWPISKGSTAPQAAGTIHSDIERGFIRAEIVSYEDYVEFVTMEAVRAAGRLRSEGRDYVMREGDVVNFRFNV